MVSYNSNPNLRYRKIETFDGKTEYLKNCRKIDEIYYKEEDCVNISGKWYIKTNPSLLIDSETNKMFVAEARGRRIQGIISIDEKGNPIYGYFTPNSAKNVKCIDNNLSTLVIAISDEIFAGSKNYIEDLSQGVWYRHEQLTPTIIKKAQTITNYYDWTVKKYNIEENTHEFAQKNASYNQFSHPILNCHDKYGKFLNFTYGFEFEVQQGFIPEFLQSRHGIVVCRDGSIPDANGKLGMEAVTVPLSGAKGFSSLHSLCERVKDRVTLDINCSMHTHLGGYPSDKESVVALWLLCTRIQDDILDILPPYKRHWEGYKRKNYCKVLDTLGIQAPISFTIESFIKFVDLAYAKIFNFLSDFKMEFHNFKEGMRHPSGYKWDIENRKTWANFINMFFSSRKTIEFRAHQATFNPVKTINWLFITNAILKYAQVNTKQILTQKGRIRLNDVLNVYAVQNPSSVDAQFISAYLREYADSRRKEFSKALSEKDLACIWDLQEDKSYNFLMGGKNLLM